MHPTAELFTEKAWAAVVDAQQRAQQARQQLHRPPGQSPGRQVQPCTHQATSCEPRALQKALALVKFIFSVLQK